MTYTYTYAYTGYSESQHHPWVGLVWFSLVSLRDKWFINTSWSLGPTLGEAVRYRLTHDEGHQ
jgi:hypothetical protein